MIGNVSTSSKGWDALSRTRGLLDVAHEKLITRGLRFLSREQLMNFEARQTCIKKEADELHEQLCLRQFLFLNPKMLKSAKRAREVFKHAEKLLIDIHIALIDAEQAHQLRMQNSDTTHGQTDQRTVTESSPLRRCDFNASSVATLAPDPEGPFVDKCDWISLSDSIST